MQYSIIYIFQQLYSLPAVITNTRGRHPYTPLPDQCSAHEQPHPVHSARDGRSVKCRKGSAGEWKMAGGGKVMGRSDGGIQHLTAMPAAGSNHQNPEAATRTSPLPIHALRMSNNTRSAAQEMGGRSSAGRAAQVSGDGGRRESVRRGWGLAINSTLTAEARRLKVAAHCFTAKGAKIAKTKLL